MTLDAHFENYFDTDEAVEVFSKRLLTSSASMAPIPTFDRLKNDTSMESKKYSTALDSKELKEPLEGYNDRSESPVSR